MRKKYFIEQMDAIINEWTELDFLELFKSDVINHEQYKLYSVYNNDCFNKLMSIRNGIEFKKTKVIEFKVLHEMLTYDFERALNFHKSIVS